MHDHELARILHEIECRLVGLDRRIDRVIIVTERRLERIESALRLILKVLRHQGHEIREIEEEIKNPHSNLVTSGIEVKPL